MLQEGDEILADIRPAGQVVSDVGPHEREPLAAGCQAYLAIGRHGPLADVAEERLVGLHADDSAHKQVDLLLLRQHNGHLSVRVHLES